MEKPVDNLALPDPYWLCRCEGWRVVSPGGQVGTVRRVLFGSHVNEPDAFAVRSGLFRSKETIIPASEVEGLDPQGRTLTVRASAEATAFETILSARARRA